MIEEKTLPELQLPDEIDYPVSDGQPMADNTRQYEFNHLIKWGLEEVFRDRPDVFVAGDLLWYPIERDNKTRAAPDVMVAFGRPKGHRGSYQQWLEGGIAPQVVFETLSPGNRVTEMMRKFEFYREHGVQEYYLYDPDTGDLTGWVRRGDHLQIISDMQGWTSPLLGVRFEVTGMDLKLYGPDGRPFLGYLDALRERDEAARERDEVARQRDEVARERDEAARERDEERARRERLEARLREMGIDPDEGS